MTKDEAVDRLTRARQLVAEVHRATAELTDDPHAEVALREHADQAGRAVQRALGVLEP